LTSTPNSIAETEFVTEARRFAYKPQNFYKNFTKDDESD
jgi:hypothetical protein